MISAYNKDKIKHLKNEFEQLKAGKESLLVMIAEAEVPEVGGYKS